jgi:hypothetical protein
MTLLGVGGFIQKLLIRGIRLQLLEGSFRSSSSEEKDYSYKHGDLRRQRNVRSGRQGRNS